MHLEHLSELYYNKYLKKIAVDLMDIEEYSFSEPEDKERLLSLYKLRNEVYKERKGRDNKRFKTFIEEMESYKDSRIVMHFYKINENVHMVLTDDTFTKVICEL